MQLVSNIPQNRVSRKNTVSFGEHMPSRETMQYLSGLKPMERNIGSINLSKIEDVFGGINIFKGIKIKDFFTKNFVFDSILVQRGCPHQCVHCGAEASSRIRIMTIDNFKKTIDGISTLNKRLGFNPFENPKSVSLYSDSDPIIYRSKGADKKYHSIFDAAKYMYKKTDMKTGIQTAGWLSGFSKETAEKFVKDSSMLNYFGISVHPFHKYMERFIQADMKGNTQEANKWRNVYTDMIANNLETTISLKDKIQYGITLEYVREDKFLTDKNREQYYNRRAACQLYNEIADKLEIKNIDSTDLSIETRDIALEGRGFNLGRSIIAPTYQRDFNSIMIDTDGSILSNPYQLESVFFKPHPVTDDAGNPLKLNFE